MNAFLEFIFLPLVLYDCQNDYVFQQFQQFYVQDCPPPESTTSLRSKIKIDINTSFYDSWPSSVEFAIQRNDITHFIYKPESDIVTLQDKRFQIEREETSDNFIISLVFHFDDSGSDFLFGWRENATEHYKIFCTVLLYENLIPTAFLERRGPPEMGYKDRKYYREGERIIVLCKVHRLHKVSFFIVFPQKAQVVLESETPEQLEYSVLLTKDIKNGNISCVVPDGISTWTTDFLKFKDKLIPNPEPSRRGIAFALSIFCCILLIIMVVFGSYILIIKQRKLNTKVLQAHYKLATICLLNEHMRILRELSSITLSSRSLSSAMKKGSTTHSNLT